MHMSTYQFRPLDPVGAPVASHHLCNFRLSSNSQHDCTAVCQAACTCPAQTCDMHCAHGMQSGSDSIREAARMLLAAALDPRSYALPSGVAPFAAFALIIAAGRHPGRVPANELPGLLQKVILELLPLTRVQRLPHNWQGRLSRPLGKSFIRSSDFSVSG